MLRSIYPAQYMVCTKTLITYQLQHSNCSTYISKAMPHPQRNSDHIFTVSLFINCPHNCIPDSTDFCSSSLSWEFFSFVSSSLTWDSTARQGRVSRSKLAHNHSYIHMYKHVATGNIYTDKTNIQLVHSWEHNQTKCYEMLDGNTIHCPCAIIFAIATYLKHLLVHRMRR